MSLLTPAPGTLDTFASLFDAGYGDAPGNQLVVLRPDAEGIDVEVNALGATHPFEALAGRCLDPGVWAVGVRAGGRAHHLELPELEPEPVVATLFVDRSGAQASLIRVGEDVRRVGPTEGTIADACLRALGLPTPPPPAPALALWTTAWLDRSLEAWIDPARRRLVSTSWPALARLHPAAARARPSSLATPAALAARARRHATRYGWSWLRERPELLPAPAALDPCLALWMDDGFFARFALGAFPPAERLATELAELLEPPQRARLLEALTAMLAR